MFKIMVDGIEHSRYDNEQVWIDVGSAEDAEVWLPWAQEQHLKIYPCWRQNFLVSVHASDGMVYKTKWRYPNHPWKVFVHTGGVMKIKGHKIQAINCSTMVADS